jgi:AraC-like DNA-binding protein/mannose-6-phosphate isomerase-like protein (cupin superfamily)
MACGWLIIVANTNNVKLIIMSNLNPSAVSNATKKNEVPVKDNCRSVFNHFEIHTLEWYLQNRSVADNNKRLDSFEVIYVRNGAGFLTVDLHSYAIGDNTVFCLNPGQVRDFQSDGDVDGYYLNISPEFLSMAESNFNTPFFAGDNNTMMICVDQDAKSELEEILARMKKEFTNYFLLRTEILMGFFKIMMIYLSRKTAVTAQQSACSRDASIARTFFALLKKHFTSMRMVSDYARELSVTPNYLNQVIKKISGFSASHHIQQQIVLEAKRQAKYSSRSMKEIAYSLGFEDMAHFSKFFKNNSGMNFSSFKKVAYI